MADADTVLRVLKKLATKNEEVTSTKGNVYQTNRNDQLNDLNIKVLLKTGLLEAGNMYDFDYDNEVLPHEKTDSKNTYKHYKNYQVTSVDYQPFSHKNNKPAKTYRLVRLREEIGDKQLNLFTKDTVPSKWVEKSRGMELVLFTSKPYE